MSCHSEARYAFGKMWCVAVRDCDGKEMSSLQECSEIQYKIDRGYFPACNTPCAPTLVVTSITAVQGTLQPDGKYFDVTITVSYTGTGTFRILKDGGEIHRETVTSGSSKTYVWGFPPSNTPYQICAEAV